MRNQSGHPSLGWGVPCFSDHPAVSHQMAHRAAHPGQGTVGSGDNPLSGPKHGMRLVNLANISGDRLIPVISLVLRVHNSFLPSYDHCRRGLFVFFKYKINEMFLLLASDSFDYSSEIKPMYLYTNLKQPRYVLFFTIWWSNKKRKMTLHCSFIEKCCPQLQVLCRNSFQNLKNPDISGMELLKDVQNKHGVWVRLVIFDTEH